MPRAITPSGRPSPRPSFDPRSPFAVGLEVGGLLATLDEKSDVRTEHVVHVGVDEITDEVVGTVLEPLDSIGNEMSVLLKQFVEFTSATSSGSAKIISTHYVLIRLVCLYQRRRVQRGGLHYITLLQWWSSPRPVSSLYPLH